MKGFALILAVLMMTGCATQEQKDEVKILKRLHQSERKIERGESLKKSGESIQIRGEFIISNGESERDAAYKELMESIGGVE